MAYNYDRTSKTAAKSDAIKMIEAIKMFGEASYWDLLGIVKVRQNPQALLKRLETDGYLKGRRVVDEDGDEIIKYTVIREPVYLAKSGKISKANLEKWLQSKGWPMPGYEAYGRSVHAYWFKNPPGMNREEFERALAEVGGRVDPRWNAGKPGASISNVSFFKAHGWNQ